MNTVLFYIHHGLTLCSGVILSAAFCDVRFTKKNLGILTGIILLCGILLLSTQVTLGEQRVWELYPLIVHGVLGAFLVLLFRKRLVTVLASISLAYLCCQPSKYFGLLADSFGANQAAVWCIRIVASFTVTVLILFRLKKLISEIFAKDTRSVLIFSSVPFVYYLFDYTVGIYTDLWHSHSRLIFEFLAFFLCVTFMSFCVVYYREYERKMQSQRKNEIIEITVQQQAKEIEAVRKSNLETNLLRHDMRLLLSNLALSIEQDDKQSALNLLSGYISQVDAAALHRFCQNDTVNYILTNYESKCKKVDISFDADVKIDTLSVDEIMFASIISNALDNAMNAQLVLPTKDRQIKLMLKNSDGKLLLSVKNPFQGSLSLDPEKHIPESTKEGHGYGVQSILYMTEKLGGKCQFSVQDSTFVLRVVLP